jgi:hypothetical protein
LSHGYLFSQGSDSSLAVAEQPAFSDDGSIASVPPGNYMIWAQASFHDGGNEPQVTCQVEVNGAPIPPVAADGTGIASAEATLKNGIGGFTIVSADTLTTPGSTVEVDCASADNSTLVSVSLSLLRVDALN